MTRATLRISFRDMQRTTVTATNFILQNAPDGRDVNLLTRTAGGVHLRHQRECGGHHRG